MQDCSNVVLGSEGKYVVLLQKPRRNPLQSPSLLNRSEFPYYTADVRDSRFSALQTPEPNWFQKRNQPNYTTNP